MAFGGIYFESIRDVRIFKTRNYPHHMKDGIPEDSKSRKRDRKGTEVSAVQYREGQMLVRDNHPWT